MVGRVLGKRKGIDRGNWMARGEMLLPYIIIMVQYLSSQAKAKTQTKAQILNKERKDVTNLWTPSSFKKKKTVIRKYWSTIKIHLFMFFLMSTCEQQTAIDLVNLICFLPTVSSDYTDFVREFEQNHLKKLTTHLIYKYKSRSHKGVKSEKYPHK